nr:coagulation factor V-like [Ipomoea batatas]
MSYLASSSHSSVRCRRPRTRSRRPDRKPEAVAADREPEVVAADREPEAVAVDREPEAVTVDREPEAVAADREPEAIAAIAVHREPATGVPQTAVGSVASPRKDLPCRQSRFRRLLFLLQFRFQCSRLAEGTGQRRNMKWKSKLGLSSHFLLWSNVWWQYADNSLQRCNSLEIKYEVKF